MVLNLWYAWYLVVPEGLSGGTRVASFYLQKAWFHSFLVFISGFASSFFIARFSWGLRGQHLKIKPSHFMIFNHIHHFA